MKVCNFLVEALNIIVSGKKNVHMPVHSFIRLDPENDQYVILINRLLICLVVDFLFARFPILGKLFTISFSMCAM